MISKIHFKSFVICLLVICMIISIFPFSVLAVDTELAADETVSKEEVIISENDDQISTPSYYDQLLSCTDAESMYMLLIEHSDLASSLTADEINTLTELAQSYTEDEEGSTYREDLLATLSALAGTYISELPEVLIDSSATLSVEVYNKEPGDPTAQLIATLLPDGSGIADIGNWLYTDSRYLDIQLIDIPADKEFELVITMQPIVKAMSLPDVAGTTRSFTINTMFVNNGGTFTAENYSGTIVYKIDKGTRLLGFPLELGYDITLWNKLAGELNYTPETPLLSVYLREVGSDVKQEQVNLHLAQAPAKWAESIYITYDGKTESANKFMTDSTSVGVTRMVNGSYSHGFYYPKAEFVVTYPSYTYNDIVYYLDCDISQLKFYQSNGDVNAKIVKNDENHTVTITLTNYYSTSNNQFETLMFSMSEESKNELPQDVYKFVGTASVTLFRSTSDETGELIKSGNINITYSTKKDVKLSAPTNDGTTSVYNTDTVNHLGTYGLKNDGFSDSGNLYIKMEFDTGNTNAIHVTTARLFADNIQEKLIVKYTMVDAEGNIVVTDGVQELNNPYYEYPDTMEKTRNYLFCRESLDNKDHRKYYFKTIEYLLAEVPADTVLYASSGVKGRTGTGSFWGYVNGSAGTNVVSKITVYDYSDGETTINTVLTKNVKTNIYATNDSSYRLIDPKVDKTEISAGESITVSGTFEVSHYPYGYTMGVHKVRIGLNLPQGIEFTEDDVTATTNKSKKSATDIIVNKPTSENPLWIIEFSNPDVVVGYNNEKLDVLPDGDDWNFSITLHTNATMEERTLILRNILWAAGDGQPNRAGGAQDAYRCSDVVINGINVDLNNYTGNNDYVSCFTNSTSTQFTIKAAPALLDITAGVRGSLETISDDDAALEHFADYVTYDLKIACTDGGSSKDFYYLIPIPKYNSPDNNQFVSKHQVDFNLKDQPIVTHSGGAVFKLLYTTTDASSLTYDNASTNTNIAWAEAEDVSDWTKVTMIKIVPTSDIIETGTLSVISVPLEYADNNYQYAEDAVNYAHDAGKVIEFSSRGYYNHQKGSQLFAGNESADLVTVRLKYTIPETQELTLVAAKDRDPNNGAVVQGEFTIDTTFILEQNYGVRMVNPSNVTLVPTTSDFTGLNSNTNFGIKVSLNGGTEKDIDETASVDQPIELGTVASQGTARFTFELFNGNALSDTTTPRIVRLDIIGHNGVTIPVEITIKVIAAPVEDATVSIIDYNEYLPFSGSNSVSISQGSALTAQFVANELVPANYPSRVLSFNTAPTDGTTVLMIDWTTKTSPKYYYYKLNGSTSSIPLTNFTNLSNGNPYVNPTGNVPIAAETLLFIVDFAETGESSSEIRLTRQGNNVDDISQSLTYSVGSTRQFSLAVPVSNVEIEEEFAIGYSNTAPSSTDNRYSNRKMSLVISASGGYTLPVDTKLVIEDKVYTQNAYGQFIVPVGSVSFSGTGTGIKKMELYSETLTSNCTLNVDLYVSATANDSEPFAGEKVCTQSFTVTPQTHPSFKVTDMSNRMFISGEDTYSAEVTYEYKNIANCVVYLEVQRKAGTDGTGYATDAFYLSTLNGIQATNTKINITNIVNENSALSLVFKDDLANDTYRLLFTVVKNGEEVLTIPYNFMVVAD